MTSIRKRLLSLLLTAVMVFGMLPTSAFAADVEEKTEIEQPTEVVTVVSDNEGTTGTNESEKEPAPSGSEDPVTPPAGGDDPDTPPAGGGDDPDTPPAGGEDPIVPGGDDPVVPGGDEPDPDPDPDPEEDKTDANGNGVDDAEDVFAVVYDLAGGTTESEQTTFTGLKVGDSTPSVKDPVLEDFTFAGWNPAVAAVVSAADAKDSADKLTITYTASWKKALAADENGNGIIC